MYPIGKVEKDIYALRKRGPIVIPQLDPDNHDQNSAERWFKRVEELGLKVISMGGSTVDALITQKLLDIAVKDHDFDVIIYMSSNPSSINGIKGKTAVYWGQIPNAQNTFYTWDGLIANSLSLERNNIDPLPTLYAFDERGTTGSAEWISRGFSIPREKPKISLAVARAAQYLGMRFYIMAGGSGSPNPPPPTHVKLLATHSNLLVIPTSGIKTKEFANELFSAGADAIQIGSLLESEKGFDVLKLMVGAAKHYPGKDFI
jgi:phosphoglycerol geranylgeranyltransferase